MNYYVLQDEKIALFDSDYDRLKSTLDFKPNGIEATEADIQTTEDEIVKLNDGTYHLYSDVKEQYDAEQAEREEEEQTQADIRENEKYLAEIKNDILSAIALNDDEWLLELREEYQSILNEE